MNVVMIAHGNVASSTLHALEMILGPLEDIKAIDFFENDSIDTLSNRLSACLSSSTTYIFCDIKGGTPFNAAYLLAKKYPLNIICGLNLAMMLECLLKRNMEESFSMLETAEKAGKEAIEVFDLEKGGHI